jgi:predicted RNA-binding Zn ribbon-like protein
VFEDTASPAANRVAHRRAHRRQRELRRALAEAELTPTASRYRLTPRPSTELDRIFWPITRSAAELLTSADIDRVRECDGRGCGWLFLDTSKAGRRRWCSMAICGNRAKARRHRETRDLFPPR